jgi:hypothetical protein
MKNYTLIFGIITAIITTILILAAFFFLNPTYLNLGFICFTSIIGYITSAVYLVTYFETKKIKNER